MSHFDFKQFRIRHDQCAMKVGTDGVLLGAWAEIGGSQRILDIGAGSGLITIMLAQRAKTAMVHGIEIDPAAARQAAENAAASPFAERITITEADITQYPSDQLYDNIVSNPPYFTENTLPPNAHRATARHTEGLPLSVLVGHAKRLMTPNALFQVILPTTALSSFLGICALHGLSLLKRTDVCTKVGKPYKRTLLCLANRMSAPSAPVYDTLSLSDGQGGRSEEYQKLTEDFYL